MISGLIGEQKDHSGDNPRSQKLSRILESISEPANFDLRFFTASFAGYGMHDACMARLEDFKKLVKKHSELTGELG
jgi:hypothetical protein